MPVTGVSLLSVVGAVTVTGVADGTTIENNTIFSAVQWYLGYLLPQ